MNRLTVTVAALAPLAGLHAAAPAVAKRPPNIVLILIDDMGWKDVAANGSRYYKTPNIDRLAAEGVRFTHGYAPAAVCSPSRAAILTGKSPARLHITDYIPGEGQPKAGALRIPDWNKTGLTAETPTLPRLLKATGYATATVGKWHLGALPPETAGFDLNVGGGENGQPASYFWPYGQAGNHYRVRGLAESGGSDGEYLTDRLTDEALRFIDANRSRPFFLYLPHYAVHAPIMAKEGDLALFKDSPGDGRQNYPAYAAMVKSVDDSVGRILDKIKAEGLENDTVVVFTSDNGGVVTFRATDNAPLRAGKGFPYEGGLRVPLLIKAPGVTRAGTVCDTPVIGTDLMPTLAGLAGARVPADTDGRDLAPLLCGGALARETLVWHYPHYWTGTLITPYSVIRHGDWKLVRWHEYATDELYHLVRDPSEQSDLAAAEPARVRELAALLDAELKRQGAQLPGPRPDARPARSPAENRAAGPRFRVR